MGNIQQQQQAKKPSVHKFVLEIRDREIILDFKNKIKLIIGDVLSFPSGGFEGLHLWDSNIVLSRYILLNKQQFDGKSIIQLFSGTGIASITLKKYTKANKIAATDHSCEVTSNISKNCIKNQINQGIIVVCIAWEEYKNYKTKFDFVIGADLFFKGSKIQLLISALTSLLNVGGKALFVSPNKSNDADNSQQFIQKLDKQIFNVKKQKLLNEMYMQSPLLNQVQGYEEFKQLSQGYFHLFTIEKLKQPLIKKQQIKRIISMTQVNELSKHQNKSFEEIQLKIARKVSQTEKQKSEHIKKQLEAVTIKRKEDVPQYQRKKRKDLMDIIEGDETRERKKSVKQIAELHQQAAQIQIVKQQHQLYDQPDKKSQSQKKQLIQNNNQIKELVSKKGSRKQNIENDNRIRKSSNPT